MITVLLVEDEVNLRTRFRKLLEEVIGGCRVVGEAANGCEALEWLKTQMADVVITDIRMKDMNGIELLKRLKEQYPSMPVVIVSGYGDFEYAKDAIKYEVTDYLLKPVDRVELNQVIEKLRKRLQPAAPAHSSAEPAEGEERQIIRKVKDIIASRLDQDISLQYLADQVHLNHRYLSALFKTESGQNLSDYVTACRMDKAKSLLRTTQLKIQDIARSCGYPNSKYFMSVFKQVVGSTPSEYRDRAGQV
jgi:Response regulator containing CheY-like receiver domain and AraC-type DNA-binding domain